ncbi:MAG: 2-octaprenyl-6-methoxyphenyl hydroxylase [Chromatocurvus sp.]
MTRTANVVIAGGGMVGISLALHLAASLPESQSVTLIESYPLRGGNGDYHPSFDARSTALSYSSRLIYEDLGLWQTLSTWAEPIRRIHVSSQGRFGSSLMDADDQGWPGLGYVVENAWLGRVLLEALLASSRIQIVSPASAIAAKPRDGRMEVSLDTADPGTLVADLLVIADGAQSRLREGLGIGVSRRRYEQHALVANVAFAGPHSGVAYERFTADGPLALLPLPATADAPYRAALVWTLPEERAHDLAAAEPAAFLQALQKTFGYRLGRAVQVGERFTYPLSLVESRECVRRHVVVVGNAAHALHPVAGQGFNLALRDVAALSAVLAQAEANGETTGDPVVLARYAARQRADQQRTIAASDMLPGLFMNADPVFGLARDLALSGLDLARSAKSLFVRHAAGIAALEARNG